MSEMSDHDRLIRIDEKVDVIRLWQDEHMERCRVKHAKLDADIQALKEWKYREAGGLAVFVFLVNLLGHWVMGFFGGDN